MPLKPEEIRRKKYAKTIRHYVKCIDARLEEMELPGIISLVPSEPKDLIHLLRRIYCQLGWDIEVLFTDKAWVLKFSCG